MATGPNIEKVASELGSCNIKEADTVVMDLLSNSVYMGSDESGLPVRPSKSPSDGLYHVPGDLQVAPESMLKKF